MSKEQNSWEKQFSSFERDIDSREEQVAHEEVPDSLLAQKDVDMPAVSVHEEPSRQEDAPMNAEGMAKLVAILDTGVKAAVPLRDQTRRMLDGHDDLRLPKGLRSAARIIGEITDVLLASKAIVSLFLELGVEPLYQFIEDCRLKATARSTVSTFISHVPAMQEGLNDVEQAMSEGYDRPSANLRMRIVKAQAEMTRSLAVQQAQALAKVIESFPLENGPLRLLCIIKEKGDKEVMGSIDRSMELADHVQVYVEYAPDMLAAVQKNDQKAVDAIVTKMLDNS